MASSPLSRTNFIPVLRGSALDLPANRVFTTVHELAADSELSNREDRFLVAMLLRVKASESNSTVSLLPTPTSSRVGENYLNNQRLKRRKTNASYRRIFFFLDLLTQGKCFVIFEEDQGDENNYWRDMNARSSSRVGDIFLITEPHRIESEINGHLSVVRTEREFIPIEMPATMHSFMPTIPDRDTFIGYFLKERQIVLHNIISCDTRCAGTFCDRLYPRVSPCGCYQRTNNQSHVLKQDIEFNGGLGGTECLVTCSSLRFSELLFSSALPFNTSNNTNIIPKLPQLRVALRLLVTYVNQNGGWTISGWFRQGTVREAGTEELVFNDTLGIRISYIQPTDHTILANEGFKALQLDPATFLFS